MNPRDIALLANCHIGVIRGGVAGRLKIARSLRRGGWVARYQMRTRWFAGSQSLSPSFTPKAS